ncbi:MAG: hypothetical protein ABSG21_15890, partial [Spirochaetia bacterium]
IRKARSMFNRIRCEAVDVRTDTLVCPGVAKTKRGEVYELDGRTPVPVGMCCMALSALNANRLAMAVTPLGLDAKDSLDITCPHGAVTFRLSRLG